MSVTSGSTFKFKLAISARVRAENREFSREEFFEWLWARLGPKGLLGLHEGTVLSEEAAGQGFETESWTLDSGEAPRERDWIGDQKSLEAELYFGSRTEAEAASVDLAQVAPDLTPGPVEEQVAQDWDAQWKASFTGAFVLPNWHVLPPWVDAPASGQLLRINPGAGFGTGTHETTQLCLELLARENSLKPLRAKRVLDFGSGSGILAIGAALLGGAIEAVEIDPLAIDNSRENASLNAMESRIQYSLALAPEHRGFDLVIANILKPVLLEFADELISRLKPGGAVILSGLIERDVVDVEARYSALLGRRGQASSKNEWRALYWPSVL